MENLLEIKGTQNTPNIFFQIERGLLMITGRSYPEYPEYVFSPIMEKLKNVKSNSLSVTFEMDYINTSSTKYILELLRKAQDQIGCISVTWVSEEDDEDMEELGLHLEDALDIKFEMRQCMSLGA
jgi:hypothetical protein